jgi:hypothetical protein
MREKPEPRAFAISTGIKSFVEGLNRGRSRTMTFEKLFIECFECGFWPSRLQQTFKNPDAFELVSNRAALWKI